MVSAQGSANRCILVLFVKFIIPTPATLVPFIFLYI